MGPLTCREHGSYVFTSLPSYTALVLVSHRGPKAMDLNSQQAVGSPPSLSLQTHLTLVTTLPQLWPNCYLAWLGSLVSKTPGYTCSPIHTPLHSTVIFKHVNPKSCSPTSNPSTASNSTRLKVLLPTSL